MKKLLSLIVFLLVAGCLFSCAPTTKNSDRFISPSDEESAVYTVTQTDGNGLKLEVTLHGYKSESLGKEFYVKNNEYFLADVKLTNESSTPVYQWLPTACREMSPAHNHEIKFDIANGDYKLNSSSFGFACPERTDLWTVEPGASYEWQLKLAVGEQQNGKQDLPADGTGYAAGIKLYEKDIFTDHICAFEGNFSFAYRKNEPNEDDTANDSSVSVPLSIEVVYVSGTAD